MIKYFYKSSLSDRVVRRKEMLVSCRRKYSAALVVDPSEKEYSFFFVPPCLNHISSCLPDALPSQHLAWAVKCKQIICVFLLYTGALDKDIQAGRHQASCGVESNIIMSVYYCTWASAPGKIGLGSFGMRLCWSCFADFVTHLGFMYCIVSSGLCSFDRPVGWPTLCELCIWFVSFMSLKQKERKHWIEKDWGGVKFRPRTKG